MLLTNYKDKPLENFSKFFLDATIGARGVRIASGYVGQDVFIAQIPLLKKVLQENGVVQLIFGISLWDGVTKKCEAAMREFHDFASTFNNGSGIFIVRTSKYHGKIYHYEYPEPRQAIATVGSSNFSSSGFGSWRETNIVINDSRQLTDLALFFDRLRDNDTIPITLVRRFGSNKRARLPERQADQKSYVRKFAWSAAKVNNIQEAETLPVAFRLPFRVGPRFEKSSLNLFNGQGRKAENGTYTVRGWYEVENTIKKDDPCKQQLNNYLPATLGPYRFHVVTDDGQVFETTFKRKSQNRGDQGTLRELGVDFHSSSQKRIHGASARRVLGYFIKDRLVNAGVLDFGELITEETLEEYGSHELVFRDLGNDHFYMTF